MIHTEIINNIKVISFEGIDKITALNAELVKKDLHQIFSNPNTEAILNFNKINFIDSTGFGVLLSAMKTANSNNGSFKLCYINPEIMKLFRLLHLDNVFDIYENLEDCVNSF